MPHPARPCSSALRDQPGALQLTFWGTRGSVPTPGAETARFGGNTSCVEIELPGGSSLLFDAGSGIRPLGTDLVERGRALRAELFLTHFHWDHIQGLPFFAPLYDPRTHLRVHAPAQPGRTVRSLLADQMAPAHFPVRFAELPATVECAEAEPEWGVDGVEVSGIRVCHPSNTWGYRVRAQGVTVVYIPDNDLAAIGNRRSSWYSELVTFAGGADYLLHDAMFTDEEYLAHRGWGHSTLRHAVRLAEDAGVRRLYLFHHAPERSDTALLALLRALRAEAAARDAPFEVEAAAEGETVVLVPARSPEGSA